MFRLVQEWLTNIHRHSSSKSAMIRMAREGETVSLKVQDEGKGISPERLAEFRPKAPAWESLECGSGSGNLAAT